MASEQMANAYDVQATELAAAQADIERLNQELARINCALTASGARLDETARDATAARAAILQAEARASAIKHRADDLRQALDHAHEVYCQ